MPFEKSASNAGVVYPAERSVRVISGIPEFCIMWQRELHACNSLFHFMSYTVHKFCSSWGMAHELRNLRTAKLRNQFFLLLLPFHLESPSIYCRAPRIPHFSKKRHLQIPATHALGKERWEYILSFFFPFYLPSFYIAPPCVPKFLYPRPLNCLFLDPRLRFDSLVSTVWTSEDLVIPYTITVGTTFSPPYHNRRLWASEISSFHKWIPL